MYQQPAPARRSWARRHKIASVLLVAGAVLCGAGIARTLLSAASPAASPSDYRDPVQLARAIKDAEHSASAACVKLPPGKYACIVVNTDGTSGTYIVTVAADGKSYSAS